MCPPSDQLFLSFHGTVSSYGEFMGDRTGEMKNGTGTHELGQRTTLA